MLFSEHVDAVAVPDFVADKRRGKALAASLGIATAKVLTPAGGFIIKPVHGHSGRGVTLGRPATTIIEELLTGADGSIPPMDHRLHCFRGKARLLQLTKAEGVGGELAHDFMLYPAFERVKVCRYHLQRLNYDPEVVHEMAVLAEKVSQAAGLPYLRVDFYHTTRGIFWGECCVTPGFAVKTNRKITPEADVLLGSWLADKPDC